MNRLIEMIEALYAVMHTSQESEMTTYDAGHNDGIADMKKEIISLLRSHPGLWLEEITYEEAIDGGDWVVYLDGCVPTIALFSKCSGGWLDVNYQSIEKPTHLYRLPRGESK